MTLLEAFEERYRALERKPTGARVSYELWRELRLADRISHVQAQINLKGLTVPLDETLPTYAGETILVLDTELGDRIDFIFSPV
jgi:hypothetical protein